MQGLGGVSLRNLGCETLPLVGLLWVVQGAGRMFTPASREQSLQAALGELDAFSKHEAAPCWLFRLFRAFPG